jgi:hypothetical protein
MLFLCAGRVFFGWFSDHPKVDALTVSNLAILSSGLSVMIMPLCVHYELFVLDALVIVILIRNIKLKLP